VFRRYLSLVFILLLLTTSASADELRVAAASDLRFAMQEISARFEKETGNKVSVSYGSSGNYYNLLQNNAPYDLFFSADIDYPKKLESAGLTVPGSLYEYATGKLVLWVPQDSPLDLAKGLDVLLDPRVKKIAIANPQHAPYGRAAVAAMQSLKLYDRLEPKFVRGENISQTAQFVQSGNADVGFVALSLALSPEMKSKGRYIDVPVNTYPPIRQAALVLKKSPKQDLARKFLEYFRSARSLETLRQYGFIVPEAVK
jgi:molybdate transport system substrate-binding protein